MVAIATGVVGITTLTKFVVVIIVVVIVVVGVESPMVIGLR